MEYGWNIQDGANLSREEPSTFGSLSRELYYAGLLMDEIISEDVREVLRLLKGRRARADVVVPERGAAALHLLAGLEAEDFAAAVTRRALRQGADPDVRSEEGLTPVHVAAIYGRCRVLEVLLTHGANPSLIDYRLLLDAPEHAYKEQQWKAFCMMTTYTAILDQELRLSRNLDPKDDFLPDQTLRADVSRYGTSMTNCGSNTSKKQVYGGVNHDEKEVCGWLKKTLEVLPLDENAVNIVENHSRNVETYQSPVEEQKDAIQNFDDQLSGISWSKSKLRGKKVEATRQYLEDKLPWLNSPTRKPERLERKESRHSCTELKANNSSSKVGLDLLSKPNLSHHSGNDRDMEFIKDASRESEMIVYGYAASSSHQRDSITEDDAVHQESDVDQSRVVNSNLLCKMSRIFLFILKKRHSISRTSIIGRPKYKEYSSQSTY